jgi:type IV pilus biogenesis protein CpaD/CtpE
MTRNTVLTAAVTAALAISAAGCGSQSATTAATTVTHSATSTQTSGPVVSTPATPSAQQQIRKLDSNVRAAYAAKDWAKLCSYTSTEARARIAQQHNGMSCEQAITTALAFGGPAPTPPRTVSIKINGDRATITYSDGTTGPAIFENGQWKTND